jgi:rubrerythrin
MEKISKQVENAIRDAILLEIEGRKFFNHAAEVTQHEKGKKMFRFLADEEVKHMKTFGELFTEILKGGQWQKFIKAEEVSGEAPLVTKLKERMKQEEGKGEIEALRIGMELEQTAIEFFNRASREADDPVASRIFHEISSTMICSRRSTILSPIPASGWAVQNSRWTVSGNLLPATKDHAHKFA